MQLDPQRVRANVAAASTEDLLDRATVHRSGMEPEALVIIDEELARRGVRPAEVADHALRRQGALVDGAGLAVKCAYCDRPAVARAWVWHRLWGVLPVFPRQVALCAVHGGVLETPGPGER
jgi:hypothetical protein